MRKALCIVVWIFIILILSFFVVNNWHQEEHRKKVEYGKTTFEIEIEAGEKGLKYNWSDLQVLEYYNKKCDSLKLVPPRECPYCYCKNIIKEYYESKE